MYINNSTRIPVDLNFDLVTLRLIYKSYFVILKPNRRGKIQILKYGYFITVEPVSSVPLFATLSHRSLYFLKPFNLIRNNYFKFYETFNFSRCLWLLCIFCVESYDICTFILN
jgi:hypothetical protein